MNIQRFIKKEKRTSCQYMNFVKCLLLFIQPVWKVSFEIPEKFSIKSVVIECFELNIFNQCKREWAWASHIAMDSVVCIVVFLDGKSVYT